jgi:hypothetical protein
MIKAILMSITLIAMFAGAADAAVIYNWRTLSGEENVELDGRNEFSDQAWRARRAEVEFTGFGQPDSLGDPPTFSYPNEDADGDVDLDPDVTYFSVSFTEFFEGGIASASVNLVVGENFSLFTELFLGITFDDMDRLSGSILARGEASGFRIFGDAALWTAQYGSDNGCALTCFSTGIWELDRSTIPEPGSLLLVLIGFLGIGVVTGAKTRAPSNA